MQTNAMSERSFTTPSGTIHYWVSLISPEAPREIPCEAPHEMPHKALPWLVFLPGLTANHRLFEKQIDHFAGQANLLVWDPPSHGASRPFSLSWTMDDLAIWLHDILEQEHVKRPILIGQSMGGYTAQVFMELYPGEAAGFISIDSCPLKRSYYSWWELAALRHTKLMYLSIPWKTLVNLGSNGNSTTQYGHDLMRTMMLDYKKREYCELAAHGFRVLSDAVEADHPYEITCPYLVICGEEDRAGSAKRYNRAWAEREDAPVHWIPNAGHNSNCDAPEAINTLIEEFLQDLST